MHPESNARGLPLWPLPLLCALLPLAGAHLAWWLSLSDGLVPACVPYLEGCISISRAAREGDGNALFRMLVLPSAALQALCWLAAGQWLGTMGRERRRAIAALGLVAALFLALYATFLGTEGAIYQLLRRYGVIVYFASTYLALLATLRALWHVPRHPAARGLLVVALAMLALGLATVAAGAAVDEREVRHRIENVLEWHLGLWLTVMFVLFAWHWRRLRVALC